MSAAERSYPFDARPLSHRPDRNELREFRQRMSALRATDTTASRSASDLIVPTFCAVVGSILVLSGLSNVVLGVMSRGISNAAPGIILLGVGVALSIIGISRLTSRYGREGARLDAFARANGMQYHPGRKSPKLPGMIFQIGSSRRSKNLVSGRDPRFVEFGNYQYETGSGKDSTTHRWGYIAVRLDTPLPHIVLDAESNNGLFGSNLPIGFRRDQRLGLEGDFDKHFSLYCPEGYEADALYLFTPDVMQRFLDSAAQLDVEIVDDWLFFYRRHSVVTTDPDQWAWAFSVVGAMLDKLAQWGRWRDDRLRASGLPEGSAGPTPVAADHAEMPALTNPQSLRPPKGVATEGRRLKRTNTTWVVIAFAALVFIVVRFFGLG